MFEVRIISDVAMTGYEPYDEGINITVDINEV